MTIKCCIICESKFNAIKNAKTCSVECKKERRRRADNVKSKTYYHAHKHDSNYRNSVNQRNKIYRERNFEKSKESSKKSSFKWRLRNPEQARESSRVACMKRKRAIARVKTRIALNQMESENGI